MKLWDMLDEIPRLRAIVLGFTLHPAVLAGWGLVRRWVVGL